MPRLAAQAEEQLKPAVGGLLSNAQIGTILNRDKLLAEAVPKAAPRAPAVSEPAPQAEWADRQYEQSLISATASAISSRVVAPSTPWESAPLADGQALEDLRRGGHRAHRVRDDTQLRFRGVEQGLGQGVREHHAGRAGYRRSRTRLRRERAAG
jgi:hypothetical protein